MHQDFARCMCVCVRMMTFFFGQDVISKQRNIYSNSQPTFGETILMLSLWWSISLETNLDAKHTFYVTLPLQGALSCCFSFRRTGRQNPAYFFLIDCFSLAFLLTADHWGTSF